jgi:hypothetical protein
MVRRLPLLAGLVILFFCAGAVLKGGEIDQPWVRGIFTGRSPRPQLLVEPEAWQRASELALRTPGAFVLVGGGESMLPLYAPGTILVMQQCTYKELLRGQTAIYRNHEGKVVAHVLITKAHDGWRVAGLNNQIHDMEPVLAQNLVGVVIAAFRPLAANRRVHLAANP